MSFVPSRAAVILFAVLSAIRAQAADHVRIDTISYVRPGTQNLPIGVYLSNDAPIVAVVLPFEIRTCDGAYIAGPIFSHQMNLTGRLYNSPLSPIADPNGRWPAAIYVQRTLAEEGEIEFGECPRNDTATTAWTTETAAVDFESPDAIHMVSVTTGNPGVGEEFVLPPGTDPAGVPSYVITVNVGATPGVFVIDTTCIAPSNKLRFASSTDRPFFYFPTFQQGIIGVGVPAAPCGTQVACSCPCFTNPSQCLGKSAMGILDVVTTIDVAFRGIPETRTAACPYYSTDVDCTGSTDVVDVIRLIDVAFRGADPASSYCEPCGTTQTR